LLCHHGVETVTMALQVLSFVFKLGKMLALTPSSLTMNPETVISKLYNVLILSLLTGGVFVEISEKNFYSELIFVKKVVCIFGDLIIYILNFYSIIVLGLAKKKSWKDLMENLESTEYLVRIQNRKRDRIWYCLGIGLANLYYFASISYMVYVRYKSMGWRYLNHVQGYLDLYQKLIQWVIIKMVLARYKGLKSLLSAYKQKNQNRQFSTDLKRFEYIMSQLKTTVDVFNELFGWPLLLMIASTIIQVLNTIDFIIFYHNERLEPFDSFLVNTFLVTTALVVLPKLCETRFGNSSFRVVPSF
jgi:hypothetical protein